MLTKRSINYGKLGYRRVLVVDDIEMNQLVVKQIMVSWGFEVVLARNGKEAIEKMKNEKFDLVLMDIQMPEMDGLETTRRIRGLDDKSKASLPVVAISANLMKGDFVQLLEAGLNDCLAKPVDETKLFNIISKNLGIKVDKAVNGKNHPMPSANSKLYDLSLIQSISAGDESFTKNMISLFVETVPVTLKELQSASDQHNWEQTGRIAHKLKSTIDSMGITPLKDIIRKIEIDGKKGENLDQIPGYVQHVRITLNECIAQIREDFGLTTQAPL